MRPCPGHGSGRVVARAPCALLRSGPEHCRAVGVLLPVLFRPGPGRCRIAARPGSLPCCSTARVDAVVRAGPGCCRVATWAWSSPCCCLSSVAVMLWPGPGRWGVAVRPRSLSCFGPARIDAIVQPGPGRLCIAVRPRPGFSPAVLQPCPGRFRVAGPHNFSTTSQHQVIAKLKLLRRAHPGPTLLRSTRNRPSTPHRDLPSGLVVLLAQPLYRAGPLRFGTKACLQYHTIYNLDNVTHDAALDEQYDCNDT